MNTYICVEEGDPESESTEHIAETAAAAAIDFCKNRDAKGGYGIVARGYADVVVTDDDGNFETIFVKAETIPCYYI
ncbi:MAG: hypothetical protein Q7J84_14790 [Sulfuricaulis sp.]|nr:hypothetical protein [Sulfuricaulis sp.]